MRFYNKEKNQAKIDKLSNALAKRDTTPININSVGGSSYVSNSSKGDDVVGGATDFVNGGMKLYNGLKQSGLFNGSSGASTDGLSLGNYFGSGSSGSMTFDNIAGNTGSGSMTFDNVSGGGEGGGGGGMPWGAIGAGAKMGYNTILGKDDTEYSDAEQSTIYPLQGASTMSRFGPWGALGGALYGLGYSFKDDIGLKDNDWLTDLIFPVGMGDGHQGFMQI